MWLLQDFCILGFVCLSTRICSAADPANEETSKKAREIQRLLEERDKHTSGGLDAENAAHKASILAQQFYETGNHGQYQQAENVVDEQKSIAIREFNAAKEDETKATELQNSSGTTIIEDAEVMIKDHLIIIGVVVSIVILAASAKMVQAWATRRSLNACKESLLDPAEKQAAQSQYDQQITVRVISDPVKDQAAARKMINPHAAMLKNESAPEESPGPGSLHQEFTNAEKKDSQIRTFGMNTARIRDQQNDSSESASVQQIPGVATNYRVIPASPASERGRSNRIESRSQAGTPYVPVQRTSPGPVPVNHPQGGQQAMVQTVGFRPAVRSAGSMVRASSPSFERVAGTLPPRGRLPGQSSPMYPGVGHVLPSPVVLRR
eukprot:gnl/MRDRNA2_/MRDRNA2_149532_c0_seq1.p1 gnl/MRDRNA2_/MRDRNA2_149532_c0~~gnl/MRDRNA2_/MRDRNA2_149532_c0_seq1.p1  ORF type:complete len:379 (+),score=61.43 gnl/MRDRNA2_/MRDRNA2_149532_c0_seq1:120-1256(+)